MMKRKSLFAAACLSLVCLTACQSAKSTTGDSYWDDAKSAGNFNDYVKEHAGDFDMEALKAEAGSSDSTLSQQFKAVSLLSAAEYQNYEGEDSQFLFHYPISAEYANNYLAKAKSEGENFFAAFEDAFYPYECMEPVFAAADNLDGETLTHLLNDVPADAGYNSKITDTVDKWVKANPTKIPEIYDALKALGFFDDWTLDDWKTAYFYSYLEPYHVRTGAAGDAFTYVSYLRESILPELEVKFGTDDFKTASELNEEKYFSTKLTVAVTDGPELKDGEADTSSEAIELEGKKVAAFYRNTQTEEFKNSPPTLQLMGDFMLQLSDEEFPKSPEEADYYLILTPSYEYGDFYQDNAGNETKVQQVNATTAIDLYDAKTGAPLRHLGDITETPASSIFRDLSEESLEYPEITSADILACIYHNINTPDAYTSLLDNTVGLNSELQKDESVILGNWEITYHSSQTVKEFDEGMFRYTAKDGCQFVRGEFTIKNIGTETDTFLPMVYYVAEDPIVQIADTNRENFYDCVDAMSNSRCLNSTSLEPGESKDGELIFEVAEEALQGDGSLYVAVSLGNKVVYYTLN